MGLLGGHMIKALLVFAGSVVWVAIPVWVLCAWVYFRMTSPAYDTLEDSLGRWVFPILGLILGWLAAFLAGNSTLAVVLCVFVLGQAPGLWWAIANYRWLGKHYSDY